MTSGHFWSKIIPKDNKRKNNNTVLHYVLTKLDQNPSLTPVKTSSVTFNEQISEEIQCKCRLAIINENSNNFPTNKTSFCGTNKI